jgi:MFS family permease
VHAAGVMITSKKAPMFCPSSAFNTSGNECDSEAGASDSTSAKYEDSTNHAAFYVFVVAQLVSGLGSSGLMTMGLTYIDENVPKSKSSFYIGKYNHDGS